jgi:hypothetical protein
MDGQMTLSDFILSRWFDRYGDAKQAPEWVSEERCGNCSMWTILDEYEQPPSGWGVKGLCGSHRGKNQYKTNQSSYCQDFKRKECI